jgi:ribosomal protein S12 methylthiotransferase
MELQQSISLAKNRAFVGKTLEVLSEGVGELQSDAARPRAQAVHELVTVGRSYRDAPEVDGVVIVRAEVPMGQIARIKIKQASEYDLIGVPEKTLALQPIKENG